MRRFRKFLRPVPLLALVAAVQVALALGQSHAILHAQEHVAGHIHRVSPSGRATLQRTSVALACRAIVQHKACNEAPARDDHRGCTLCWMTAAAGGGMLLPPALPELMEQRAAISVRAHQAAILVPAIGTAFDARGPPLI